MATPIRRALLSVSDKTGLIPFAEFLISQNVEILSTGGTARALREAGIEVKDVSAHTGFPEIMDGRVKTLHPKIHGGILAQRGVAEHQKAMEEHAIDPIDLVAINLYPFEATVAKGASDSDIIENIDIGGPAMVRASAKNHAHVTIVVDPADYGRVQADMEAQAGATSQALRTELAGKAYARTAAYDTAISTWFAGRDSSTAEAATSLDIKATLKQGLRYGENPHQQAAFYAQADAAPGVATANQLQGKELSYNNINDTDAAWCLVAEFEAPAVAIIKHANPCGVAVGESLTDAFTRALACDPVSAYGGILAVNRRLEQDMVEAIGKLFLEVIIAPAISPEAAEALSAKKNLRILITGAMPDMAQQHSTIKSVLGGYLVQDGDTGRVSKDALKTASKRAPSEQEIEDMLFAFRVCKHVKSNAIVIAKDGATVGIGAGQMSRVDSVRIACHKAETAGLSTKGCVLASDAFFPFDDNVHHAAKEGIAALIQPGGSIRDDEVVAAADQYDMAMVLTGMRHFRH